MEDMSTGFNSGRKQAISDESVPLPMSASHLKAPSIEALGRDPGGMPLA
jgi:hypothetical protein